MADEQWTVDATEATNISLVQHGPNGLTRIETFQPRFTYPIFEEERIFGHKGLRITIDFNASDMRPHFSTSSAKKYADVSGTEPEDVRATMEEFLPKVAFQKRSDFEAAIKDVPVSWTPPGERIETITKNGDTYEIWRGTLDDPAVRQLVKRLQIFVLFFIEGGSYIGVDAEGKDEQDSTLARWAVYFVYKKQLDTATDTTSKSPQYIFQGYSTVYNFWLFQDLTPPSSPKQDRTAAIQPRTDEAWELPKGDISIRDMAHRARISQFVILPPFQGKGIGAMLYNTIFGRHVREEATKEVTIEDPNEDFDLLRDLCDMRYLRKNEPDFAALKVNNKIPTIPKFGGVLHNDTRITLSDKNASSTSDADASGVVDIDALEKLRVKTKIAPRQFWRLVEMHLMSTLPESVRPVADLSAPRPAPSKEDEHAYTLWRLLLKQRLYRRNISILGEFEITERILKLNETVSNVEGEYARILERLDATPSSAADKNGKRKADDLGLEKTLVSKRVRIEEP
ncbi:histone acetyltransferase type B catalytic subunit [Microdochium trichocladiopsis]|uniref:Histone acetyltransferase type B catalytic subunit n=1 Tax=Microdochium trichocladiopsis TaxID=1682393 RepID=A0A9P8YFL5_9PEZI|nr:histone acetyltransferase type B catalytic subunit [Microdochium trichocladiopsis]KAH7038091.1 histone acetyltransferase type B catalytic subunit [Microdochium trichocladiopsis]